MSFKRFLCIAALFCGFGANNLRAQGSVGAPEWRLAGWHNNGPGWTAIYFIDPTHGISAVNGGIDYSTPGDWWPASMPAGITLVRSIRSIQGKLYAASKGTDVLVSTDSGRSWKFSGLGLNNANDVYADGTGNIRILTDPMTRFARIDTMHCVATGNGSIFTSSDGGLNWITAVTGIDSASTGAFGDPCYHVFVCPSTSDYAALRSTDSGRSWQSVITGSYAYPEFIYGASTVTYLNDMYGFYRSIDDGVTWTQIITVDGGPHVMCVWGPMGEHVAMGWVPSFGSLSPPGIYMTTTGGDDNLHSAVAMTDSNGAPLSQEDTMNVPFLVTSMCNTFSIPIALEADVPGLSVTATLANNSGGDVTLLGADSLYFSSPIVGQRYSQDTMWLGYDPHHAADTALITFENHWNCSDWSETRTVIITAFPKAQIVPPPVLSGNCQPVSGAAFLMLDSCQTLVIDSIEIPPYLSSMLHFTNPLPDTARIGINDSLYFTFDPADTVAAILDSIQIFAHYLGRDIDSNLNYFNYNAYAFGDSDFAFFQQFVPVNLVALQHVSQLAASPALDVDTTYICEERDTFVVIHNIGCDSVCVTGVSSSSPDFVITSGGNAICLAPGENDTVRLLTQIDTSGDARSNNASLTITSTAQTPLAPIALSREIEYPVAWGLHLSPPDSAAAGADVTYEIIQAGTLPTDVTTLDFTLTYNDDLLSFIRAEEPSVDTVGYLRTADGLAHLSFQVTPVGTDSVVATLHFIPYVAASSQTAIDIENIVLVSSRGRSSDCIASLTTGQPQTVFTLSQECGYSVLEGVLQNGVIRIDNIKPNPASGAIVVSVSSGGSSAMPAELSIVDALGRTVSSKAAVLAGSEENYFQLNLENLPSGMYAAQLHVAGITSTREFVKE